MRSDRYPLLKIRGEWNEKDIRYIYVPYRRGEEPSMNSAARIRSHGVLHDDEKKLAWSNRIMDIPFQP